MELLISILIGILFAIGTYMMLSRKLYVAWHAADADDCGQA